MTMAAAPAGGADPVSAIAGAAGGVFNAIGAAFSFGTAKQQRKAVEAQAESDMFQAQKAYDIERVSGGNQFVSQLIGLEAQKLDIRKAQVEASADAPNPLNSLVLLAGIVFVGLLVYFIIKKNQK